MDMGSLNLEYEPQFESQNIDLEKLRPNKSYDYLIENRNSSIYNLIDTMIYTMILFSFAAHDFAAELVLYPAISYYCIFWTL